MASIAMPLSGLPSRVCSAKVWMLICDLSGVQIALPGCADRMRTIMMWNTCLQERELCASARILPSQYLAIKAAMLREAAQRGILPRSEARTTCRLDASRALKVCIAYFTAIMNDDLCLSVLMYVPDGNWASEHCPAEFTAVRAVTVQVYDLLVACGWMIGSHTSASSAAVHRVDGQPGPSNAGVVKCDPLEGQTGFSNSLQGFPGFHIGSYQL